MCACVCVCVCVCKLYHFSQFFDGAANVSSHVSCLSGGGDGGGVSGDGDGGVSGVSAASGDGDGGVSGGGCGVVMVIVVMGMVTMGAVVILTVVASRKHVHQGRGGLQTFCLLALDFMGKPR